MFKITTDTTIDMFVYYYNLIFLAFEVLQLLILPNLIVCYIALRGMEKSNNSIMCGM